MPSQTTLLTAAITALRRRHIAPTTRRLVTDTVRLQVRAWTAELAARVRPIQGLGGWRTPERGGNDATAVVDGRRILVNAGLRTSIHERQVDAADAWTGALADQGVDTHPALTSRGSELHVSGSASFPPHALHAGGAALGPSWTVDMSGEGETRVRRHDRFDKGSPVRAIDVRIRSARCDGEHAELPPIDIVVTWVDPTDPTWQRSFESFRSDGHDAATHVSRFENHDELRFALRSIWLHCGWFRHVIVVTAGETPTWMRRHERLRVVRHDEFMPTSALPTFNSHAIESRLHYIPGLAERFVYLNDDFFVGRPTSPATFFGDNFTTPQIFALDEPLPDDQPAEPGQLAAAWRTSEIVSNHFTRPDIRLLAHAPYAGSVSNTYAVERVASADFERTAHSRFRSPTDLSVAASLAPWWSVTSGVGILANPSVEYVSLGHPTTPIRLRRIRLDPPDFWCANRTERSGPGQQAAQLSRTLRAMYPEQAPWEAR